MKKVLKTIFDRSFIFYLLIFILLFYLGVSFLGMGNHIWTDISLIKNIKRNSNFVPFKTIGTYTNALFEGSQNISVLIKSLSGKFFIFAQAGFLLPFFSKKLKKARRFMFSMSALLLIIEAIQLITRRGNFNIDDFILNMAAALIGYSIWKTKRVQRLIRKWSYRLR